MPVSTLRPKPTDAYRIVPVIPNWQSRVRESYEYRTDIITSWDGKEQRRAVRDRPRISIEFTGDNVGRSKLLVDYFMATWQARISIIADPLRFAVLRTRLSTFNPESPSTQTAIIDRAIPDIAPGHTVVLARPDGEMETRIVTNATSSSIVLSDGSETEFPAGTRVFGARFGYLQDAPKSARPTSNVASLRVQFEVDPATLSPSPAAGTAYAGWREAFMRKPDWSGGISIDHIWPRQPVDYGLGRIDQFVPHQFPSRLTRLDFVGRGRDDVVAARDFFMRHRGQQREFVAPTWENDVDYQFIAGGSRSILTPGEAFARIYQDTSVFRRIVLRMADGTFHHRSVDFVEYLPDTDTSVLWTREDLPFTSMTPTTMFGISWALVSRFASDRLEIDWLTSEVARFSLTLKTLENFDI